VWLGGGCCAIALRRPLLLSSESRPCPPAATAAAAAAAIPAILLLLSPVYSSDFGTAAAGVLNTLDVLLLLTELLLLGVVRAILGAGCWGGVAGPALALAVLLEEGGEPHPQPSAWGLYAGFCCPTLCPSSSSGSCSSCASCSSSSSAKPLTRSVVAARASVNKPPCRVCDW
jgi:peptidoglycan/LPS O-acetylase OafA/YrhL